MNYTNPNKLLFESPHPDLLPLEKEQYGNLLELVLDALLGVEPIAIGDIILTEIL